MNSKSALFSAVQFLLIVVVCSAGLFLMALPWAPQVSARCASFLTQRSDLFLPLGCFILAVGIALGVGFYFLQKKIYFQVSMKPPVSLETHVIQGILDHYWKNAFPGQHLKTEAIIRPDQKIELIAEFPLISEGHPPQMLKEIEHEIGQLLLRKLGYRKEFFFTFLNK
jgi:hypothetical protein